ncbi:MAG: mercuric transporter MerT family protein [Stellaceae bacterium]
MSDLRAKAPPAERPVRGTGAVLLTLGGLVAAFGVASCCALPLFLTTLGLGSAWLGGVGVLAAPHRALLLGGGALCLAAAGVLLWRQQRAAVTCAPGTVCAPPAIRVMILIGLLIGAGLLWAGYRYA